MCNCGRSLDCRINIGQRVIRYNPTSEKGSPRAHCSGLQQRETYVVMYHNTDYIFSVLYILVLVCWSSWIQLASHPQYALHELLQSHQFNATVMTASLLWAFIDVSCLSTTSIIKLDQLYRC